MCGISGFIFNESCDDLSLLKSMLSTLVHRGPDDYGTWVDKEKGIALGHQRLSINDLSNEGHQPMISPSGRYVLVFNGEIYNFLELRRHLESQKCTFKSNSDTEVLLVAIDLWGLTTALNRFSGMFAFALWDCQNYQLTLVRDRMGEKPLYYGWQNGVFLFWI